MSRHSNPDRLRFLSRITRKEIQLLEETTRRLFGSSPPSRNQVEQWIEDPETTERLDAFVARFDRLQDTLGDKLLPALLTHLGETPGPAIDNLDKAEKFGWIDSADNWQAYRKLRNQMIDDHIEDTGVLTSALAAGFEFVRPLTRMGETLVLEAERRCDSAPPKPAT